jgi:methyl-accepting chemotaxis protein
MDDTVNSKMARSTLVLEMRGTAQDMAIAVRNLALLNDPIEKQPEWQKLISKQRSYIQKRQELVRIMSYRVSDHGRAALAKVLASEDAAMQALMTAGKMGLENRQQEATVYLLVTARPVVTELLDALNELTAVQMQISRDTMAKNSISTARTAGILFILAALSIVISVITGWLLVRTLMRQLGGEPIHAQILASAIASGDLTTSIALRDNDTTSLLASLNGMQTNLRGLVSEIKDAAVSVALAAEEISQGNTELSTRTEQQAAALQETASSMEQLTATVKSNTAGARQTAESARETAGLARTGEADIQRMSETMSGIALSASKVQDITSVIEGIAFQTNILALNAAVEAARAGEEGRSFAVVAGEVRSLAQRSANAARDIKELIEQAVEKVESGVVVAADTGQRTLNIVSMVGELAEAMDNIALASAEQMQGISQVSIAVNQMDEVTQNNAALVEESSSASRSLSEQAHALSAMVETFRI